MIVLLVATLAGCARPESDDARSDATDQEPHDLSDLVAPTADSTESLEGGRVAFTWRDVPLPAGATIADPDTTGPVESDPVSVRFPVDSRVGIIEATVRPTSEIQASIVDHRHRSQCDFTAPADDAGTCTAHLAAPGYVSDGTEWQVRLTNLVTVESTATVRVVMHPLEHLHSIWDEADEAIREALHSEGPRFHDLRIADDGGEPTMGVLADGTLFYASARLMEETGLHGAYVVRSKDDGLTWDDVTPALNGALTLDPMMHADPWTGRVFAVQLTIACSNIAWSDDRGGSWTEHPLACGKPGINDHPKVTTGGTNLAASPVFDGVVYHAAYDVAGASLDGVGSTRQITASRSLDGGVTWTPHLAFRAGEVGSHGPGGPIEADREGNVYLPVYLCDDPDAGLAVSSSNDHGITWTPVTISAPGNGCAGLDPGMAIDAQGNAYVAGWGQGRVWVASSQDRGATWEDAVPVSPQALRSHVLVDAVAGDAGRVAVAYLATGDTEAGPNAAPGYVRWHLYLSYTEDAIAEDADWRTVRVTPVDDPVQYGRICTNGIGCNGGGRNLLDFIDVKAGPDGRLYIAYTDGCVRVAGSPCMDPATSRENHAMVAVQHKGQEDFRLFAEKAPWAASGG